LVGPAEAGKIITTGRINFTSHRSNNKQKPPWRSGKNTKAGLNIL